MIKKNSLQKLLAVLIAVTMLIPSFGFTVATAFASDGEPNTVSVNFTAYDPNSGFLAYNQKISVTEGTAAKYGLSNAAAGTMVGGNDHGVAQGEITVLDAIVAMHEIKYGSNFTSATVGDYMAGGSSFITSMFGETGGISFAVNNDLPTGDKSDGYAINECVLNNNDSVYFFIYADSMWGDYLSYFNQSSVSAVEGESFTLTLSAFQAMESLWGTPGSPSPEGHATLTTVADASICLVDSLTGAIGNEVATTDENGKATLSFDEAGTYCLTALGFVEGDYGEVPITAPVCVVNVSKPAYLSNFKFTSGTSATSAAYAMTPAAVDGFDYTVTVPDYSSSVGAWATLSPDAPADSTITAKWQTTNGTQKTQTVTSGKTSGQNLQQLLSSGCKGNTLELVVGTEGDSQTYNVEFIRTLSLSGLSAKASGTALILDNAFNRDTYDYSADVLSSAKTVLITPTAFGTQDGGYSLSVNGVGCTSGKEVPVALKGTSTVIEIAVSSDYTEDSVYTLTLNRIAVAAVTFNTTPADSIVVVRDSAGSVIAPKNGVWSLMTGAEYTYTATRNGYVGQSDSFTAQAGEEAITLVEATENTAIDATAVAQWKNFRNSDVNMGITNIATPVSPEKTEKKWAAKLGSGWANAPSVQIIADDALIVMSGTTLYKINLADGSTVDTATMAGSPSFGYTPPTYAEGMIFVPLGEGTIQAFNAKTLDSLWVYKDSKGGQSLSPITYSDGYIYSGFWTGEAHNANYVCLSVTDENIETDNEAKLATWTITVPGGFYWAGSVAVGDALIFGTDDGTGSFDSASSHLYSVNKYTGEIISCLDIVGDQRSSIAYDAASGRVFFTTKCGYLYSAAVDPSTGVLSSLKGVNYGAQSTSTPIVYGEKVYFSTGSGISTSGSSGNFVVADAASLEMLYAVGLLGYPQSSLLLSTAYYEAEGLLYFYSTYNQKPGGISLIKVNPALDTAEGAVLTELYDAVGYEQFCIASVICDKNGTLYYKNDSANVFAISSTTAYLTSLSANTGILSPEFAGEKTNYELIVPVGTAKATFNYTAPAGAAVTVNGGTDTEVTLTDGAAVAEIIVTNGKYSRTYTVNIREIGTDSSLSALKVNESNAYPSSSSAEKALTPAFSAEVTAYSALNLSSGRSFTNVWPTAADKNAIVKIYALYGVDEYAAGEEIEVTAQSSDHDRYAVYYAEGFTNCAIKIVVTAENSTDKTEYTLVLTKEDNAGNSELLIAKAQARLELDGYKNPADYREAQQTELANAVSAGNTAIDAATDVAGVSTALANAKTAIDAVKTAAQLTAKELAAAKTSAKAELAAYKKAADYRTAQQTELTNALSAGNTAIDAATDAAGVSTALANAKTAIDAIKTASQLTAKELVAAKTAAKAELASYKKASDYREAQQTELANAILIGNAAIDAATDAAGVSAAVAKAKATVDAIKTDAQLTAEEPTAAKTSAKAELAAYKNAADYREAQQTELANAVSAGNAAIDAAKDAAGISTALANAKAAIDAIKTDAQLTAEELAAAKTSAKAELAAYKNAADYREAQQTELASVVSAGNAAIDAATDAAGVSTALANAKTAGDAVKTDAQLTEEESFGYKLSQFFAAIKNFLASIISFFSQLFGTVIK